MCKRKERCIKTLQGHVKFMAVSFSIVSLFGLCILFILYFARALPIIYPQLIGKLIYVIITVLLNIMLYQATRYRNQSYLITWLVLVMVQIIVAFGYGFFTLYICIVGSIYKLIFLPVLCFIFGGLHLCFWLVVLKFAKETARLNKHLDVETDEQTKFGENWDTRDFPMMQTTKC